MDPRVRRCLPDTSPRRARLPSSLDFSATRAVANLRLSKSLPDLVDFTVGALDDHSWPSNGVYFHSVEPDFKAPKKRIMGDDFYLPSTIDFDQTTSFQ
jgi:hypothetical protein